MKRIEPAVERVLLERFGGDSVVALATVEDGMPYCRSVNTHYEGGCFYVVTHARSNKMRQIAKEPMVALSGEWFAGHGRAEDMGAFAAAANEAVAARLRRAFSVWLGNGHTDPNDPDTHILRIALTDGVLLRHGVRYEI